LIGAADHLSAKKVANLKSKGEKNKYSTLVSNAV